MTEIVASSPAGRLAALAPVDRRLITELTRVQRRAHDARRRERAARAQAVVAEWRATQIEYRLRAGSGHVWIDDPDVHRPYFEPQPVLCRLCHCHISSVVGRSPCVGDTNRCPIEVPEGTPDPAFTTWSQGTLCGHRGSFAEGFAAWTCDAGHVIDGVWVECSKSDFGCPCRFVVGRHIVNTAEARW